MGRYIHRSIEVFASAVTIGGDLMARDFPIPLIITPTGDRATDGIWGPMPLFEVTWFAEGLQQAETKFLISLCDCLIAKRYMNGGRGFWLSAISQMQLAHYYERVS